MDPLPPRVVIAGRPNVGKSSLFNALLGKRLSIVDPTPGVTRDVLERELTWEGRRFLLVDTGGIGKTEDPLAAEVRARAEGALTEADLVVFVCDARAGVAAEDRAVARRLHRLGKPVLLVANKCDVQGLNPEAAAFAALGFGEALPVSASEGREIATLRDALLARLPAPSGAAEARPLRIAVLGARNVGKSTLVNALCGRDRVLVADLPGTTRDSVEVPFRSKGGAFAAVDTAGFRSKGRISHPVELYASARARESLAACDVAFLVLDASRPVSSLDREVAREIRDAFKPVVVVVNKWDLMGDLRTGEYQAHLEDVLTGLSFAPLVVVSARDGRNLRGLLHIARALDKQSGETVPTSLLNRELESIVESLPGPGGARIPKVRFAAQVGTRPPTITIGVNDPKLFPPAYRRTLEHRLRQGRLPFTEVPLRLLFRKSGGRRG